MADKITIIGTLVLIALVVWFMTSGSSKTESSSITGNVVAGEIQKVVLSQSGLNYKDTKVQIGKPIAISADNSVTGCLRSVVFNIGGQRYSKSLRTPNDVLELPALSKGTYTFSCSMGMGYGKLIVE